MKVKVKVLRDNFTLDKVNFHPKGTIIDVERSIASSFPTLIKLIESEEQDLSQVDELEEVEETTEDAVVDSNQESEEQDLSALTNKELEQMIKDRGLKLPEKINKENLVAVLEEVEPE